MWSASLMTLAPCLSVLKRREGLGDARDLADWYEMISVLTGTKRLKKCLNIRVYKIFGFGEINIFQRNWILRLYFFQENALGIARGRKRRCHTTTHTNEPLKKVAPVPLCAHNITDSCFIYFLKVHRNTWVVGVLSADVDLFCSQDVNESGYMVPFKSVA